MSDPRPGDGLVRAGAITFAAGVLGVVLVLGGFLLGLDDLPLWTTLVASLLPVGFGIALLGLLRGVLARRRRS